MTGNARGDNRILGSLRSADGKGIVRMAAFSREGERR
jgi:hypothetical protein